MGSHHMRPLDEEHTEVMPTADWPEEDKDISESARPSVDWSKYTDPVRLLPEDMHQKPIWTHKEQAEWAIRERRLHKIWTNCAVIACASMTVPAVLLAVYFCVLIWSAMPW